MSVRARFYVSQVAKTAGQTTVVSLTAVSRGPENKEWAAYTPSGQLTMTLTPKAGAAGDWFAELLGKEVFIDITEADEPVE